MRKIKRPRGASMGTRWFLCGARIVEFQGDFGLGALWFRVGNTYSRDPRFPDIKFVIHWGDYSTVTDRCGEHEETHSYYVDCVLPLGTLLYAAFRGVCDKKHEPFGFFDLLLEQHPDLEPWVAQWLTPT